MAVGFLVPLVLGSCENWFDAAPYLVDEVLDAMDWFCKQG
uniref:Uncharacterized protein n=1 Tax=Arundo donax TaxID=35708 RepID=A0A0A8Z1J2_ARUDO